MNVLEEAESLINGERQQQYGGATESFTRIADLWASYLDVDVSPLDVTNMMILLKVSRAHDEYHRDSYVDIAGYAALGERLHNESESTAAAFEKDIVREPRVWESFLDVPIDVVVEDVDGDRWKRTLTGIFINYADTYSKWHSNADGHRPSEFAPFTEVLETE